MSWATCYSGSNNIHFDKPARMSDGRLYRNFDPSSTANNDLKNKLGIKSGYEYRQYLMKNGNYLIRKNFDSFINNSSKQDENILNRVLNDGKYLFKNLEDKSMPYGYETSDLKNVYLSRQELNSKLTAPIMTQDQMLIKKSMRL